MIHIWIGSDYECSIYVQVIWPSGKGVQFVLFYKNGKLYAAGIHQAKACDADGSSSKRNKRGYSVRKTKTG